MRAQIVVLLCALATPALAQGKARATAGNVDAGRRFAEIWCSGCHAVELRTTRSGNIAPDFSSIANRKGTSARSLNAFLGRSHDKMPNFVLDREDRDDVVAFVLSLRAR